PISVLMRFRNLLKPLYIQSTHRMFVVLAYKRRTSGPIPEHTGARFYFQRESPGFVLAFDSREGLPSVLTMFAMVDAAPLSSLREKRNLKGGVRSALG